MSREDFAWVAGFYEGEGSVCLHNCGRYKRISLQVWQSSTEPLDRTRATLGFGLIAGPYKNNSNFKRATTLKPKYLWSVSGFERVQASIAMMWPWLSQRRRARAVELMDQYRAYQAALPFQRKSEAVRGRFKNKGSTKP